TTLILTYLKDFLLLFKKCPADYSIKSCGPSDVDFHVSGNVPNDVESIVERRNVSSVQHSTAARIHNLNGFSPAGAIPIQGVKGKLMRFAIGEIQVKIEARIVVPRRRNPSRTTPCLQRSRIGG